eukprot:2206259-Pleurochrysis_carterae.AAC.1
MFCSAFCSARVCVELCADAPNWPWRVRTLADAVRFTSRTRAVAPPPQLAQAAATPDYNFHAVAPFVEARSIAPQMESEPAGDALAALAAYDDDEEEG